MGIWSNYREKPVCFLDVRGTLTDEPQADRDCFLAVLKELTGRWLPEDGEWNAGSIYRTFSKHRARHLSFEESLKRVLRRAPIESGREWLTSFRREYEGLRVHTIRIRPEAAPTLKLLAQAKAIGIISNGSRKRVERVLELGKLTPYLDEKLIVDSSGAGFRKPDPRLFRLAARKAGVKAEQCVMVGDSWRRDVKGGVDAGMLPIWLRPEQLSKPPQFIRVDSKQVAVIRRFVDLGNLAEQ
ncbi:HAD family hydrolase [Cohnella sp.]|uniref:HAD family hydrolase n=1 Tax=Cohnella sp. TaxID=1883426 RepID=UPI0035642A89